MSGAVCAHSNPQYLMIYHAFKLYIYLMHEESQSFTKLSECQTVIFLVAKKTALFEILRYVFDSLLKHQLTRDSTFNLRRSWGNEVFNKEKSNEDT